MSGPFVDSLLFVLLRKDGCAGKKEKRSRRFVSNQIQLRRCTTAWRILSPVPPPPFFAAQSSARCRNFISLSCVERGNFFGGEIYAPFSCVFQPGLGVKRRPRNFPEELDQKYVVRCVKSGMMIESDAIWGCFFCCCFFSLPVLCFIFILPWPDQKPTGQ